MTEIAEIAEVATRFGPYERSWTPRDCIIYALGVGAGTDELAYTTDTTADHPQRVIPTFMINQGLGGRGFRQAWIGDPTRTVHAGHRLEVLAPVPTRGTVVSEGEVVERVPKGSGQLVTVRWTATDPGTGAVAFRNTIAYFVREAPADGASRASAHPLGRPVPDGPPDVEVTEPTLPTQALLYRCAGDPNVIHTDPAVARAVGFRGPILHGLCTLGFATRAVLRTVCGGEPGRLRAVECRFANPGYPGDALTTAVWRVDGGAGFRTRTQDGVVLVDRGFVAVD